MTIQVKNEITVYEIDGKESFNHPPLVILSHWNFNERVTIEFEGKKITVIASDLRKAIENATNTRRF